MRRGIWIALALALVVAAAVLLNRPPGALDLAEAERLADRALAVEEKLHGQYARVDVIAPDGSWAQAPLRALGKLRVIDCPIQRQNWGDKGIGNTRISPTSRTTRYASTHYSCLFEAGIAPGPVLRLGVGIERSDDPELADLGGYSARIMDRTPLRALMTDLGVTPEAMPQARRAALRQGLEGQGLVFRDDGP